MSIHYNQTGYGQELPKKAVITGKGNNCMVLNERDMGAWSPQDGGKIVYTLSEPSYDEASGDTVRILDFSNITLPGRYIIFSDGEQVTINIKDKPYNVLCNALIKGLYYQRCGCELSDKHAGPYSHGTCHLGKAVLVKDNGEIDPNTVIDCAGGWHDAGDYGRYTAPAAATLGHMLYSYEFFPGAFKDELNIPESGNGVPDILNECRYELEWMLKMQREDGGVYHKVATRYFSGFIMPQDDKDDLFLFRVSHCSTAGFAASTALASRVYKPFDADFSNKLLQAAEKAWNWMEANPVFEPFNNPPDFRSGGYGDFSCEDELFWASAELYSVTGDKRYEEALKKRFSAVDFSGFGWRETAGFGVLCCLFILKDKLDESLFSLIKEKFLETADSKLALAMKSGYGTALGADSYVWGSILPILNNAIIMICACLLTKESKYRDAALNQLDYLLGMNATGYSFVTGFGDRPYRFPHHRPSFADGVDDPVPGLVSGGPNKQYPDMACKTIIPKDTPAAKFYIDYTPTASANEIAIYWNSPAVFVTAYFSSLM
nr:glycoside hydrolase family 9 [uncultured bacterium]